MKYMHAHVISCVLGCMYSYMSLVLGCLSQATAFSCSSEYNFSLGTPDFVIMKKRNAVTIAARRQRRLLATLNVHGAVAHFRAHLWDPRDWHEASINKLMQFIQIRGFLMG